LEIILLNNNFENNILKVPTIKIIIFLKGLKLKGANCSKQFPMKDKEPKMHK
jgi:hypothetical protein